MPSGLPRCGTRWGWTRPWRYSTPPRPKVWVRVYARLNTEHTYFDDNRALVFEMNVWRFTMA
ncbi:MAG: hypothetical protein ACOC3W_05120 [Thermodesulfobacteriota bacterium]